MSCFTSGFLRDHQSMPSDTSSNHLLCAFVVIGTMLSPFIMVPYLILRKSSVSSTSLPPGRRNIPVDLSAAQCWDIKHDMKVKAKATYSLGNVSLSIQHQGILKRRIEWKTLTFWSWWQSLLNVPNLPVGQQPFSHLIFSPRHNHMTGHHFTQDIHTLLRIPSCKAPFPGNALIPTLSS